MRLAGDESDEQADARPKEAVPREPAAFESSPDGRGKRG